MASGGGGGGGGAGKMADKEKKKKESILDLSKYIDKTIRVKFQGGREASGVLKGFDPLLNLVLDGTIEYMRGSFLFVTGGYFRDEFVWYSVDWVLIYNCLDNCWLEGPAMKKSRNSHCAVGVGLYLYVLGGSTDEGIIPAVERMALMESEWESMSPMSQPVERGDAVSVGTRIYVVCGLDENGHVYDGVQRLNTETDSWDVISFSPLPRYDLCITSLNGALYTVGGEAFRFDVETDEWTQVNEECLTQKFFMGCSTVNGQIYLLGQRKGNSTLPIVVLFDPYTDVCQVIDNKLPCPLPIHGCVSVRRFDTWA
ncbi:U6 snRNA-associated Sm-like protein LSm7 isoform X2 [Anomalospiza imberbis]|uniref:U6 snRNA-associated Sm-like protein LSm7 isoform X2 n=2 Tax=Anomalospiza imberbis TaxID=187417 RepID=UPI00358F2356